MWRWMRRPGTDSHVTAAAPAGWRAASSAPSARATIDAPHPGESPYTATTPAVSSSAGSTNPGSAVACSTGSMSHA